MEIGGAVVEIKGKGYLGETSSQMVSGHVPEDRGR